MSTQKIIITFFIVFLSLFFILNATYTFRDDPIPENKFEKTIGMQQVVSKGTGITLTPLKENQKLSENSTYIDTINYTDRVFLYSNGYAKKMSGNNVTITLKKWGIFLLDLYDISNNYVINGDNYKIKIKSPGKILVDTRESSIKIFSLSSVFNVVLTESDVEMTSLALHPKMFFSFNPVRNKFLKNADLLRLETLTNIFYFPGNIFDKDGKIAVNFLRKFNYLSDPEASEFLAVTFGILFAPDEIEKYNIDTIWKSLIPIKNLGGLDFINDYFVLFLNDQKKIAYYKKKIIENINRWFQKDTYLNKLEILNDIETFRTMSPVEFNEFLPILYQYYEAYLKVNSLDYLKNTVTLSEVIMEINGNKKNVLKSYFFLNKIYSLLNNGTFTSNDLQMNFLDFLKMYLDEQHISVGSTFLFKVQDQKIVGELDYLSLFIKNILLNDVSFEQNQKLENVFNIFKIYANLNENINVIKNNAKSETIIVENILIIDSILNQLKNNFFQPDRNEKGLLVLKDNAALSIDLLNNLNTTVEKFIMFYKTKWWSLSEKNQIYNDIYDSKSKVYQELYLALANYSDYELKYDTATKEIFDTKTVLETKKDLVLSQDHLVEYLWKFEWVDIGNIRYTIVWKNYYKISNIFINGETFSFNLYPKEGNTIKDIYRNGEKLTLSYILDDIKMTWDDAFENADKEDQDKFDFRNFFINTFFNQKEKLTQKFQDEEQTIVESKNIRLFKTEKLLWARWEFALLKWFLDVKYNNIIVSEMNSWFDIKIKDGLIRTSYEVMGESKPIIWVLNADYVFTTKDHYFKNITLKFYDPEMYESNDIIYLFNGEALNVNKNINIVDFKNEISSIILGYFTR